MEITKDDVKQYRKLLDKQYSKKSIRIALDILTCAGEAWDESYYERDYDLPAVWVVAGVCEAIENKPFWEPFND